MRSTPLLFWVISGKNSFQVYLMVFTMLSVIPTLFVGEEATPNSIRNFAPEWSVALWAIGTFAAALANLIGVYWRGGVVLGLLIEMWSSLALSLFNLMLPVAILAVNPDRAAALYIVGLVLGFSACSFGRAMQCRRAKREVVIFKESIVFARTALEEEE